MIAKTDKEILKDIEFYAKEAKLSRTLRHFKEELEEAKLQEKSYEKFLHDLLENEYDLRKENGKANRIRRANFPYKKYLEDLVIEELPEDARKKNKDI